MLVPLAVMVRVFAADPQGALQDRHAPQVQGLQLQKSHLLRTLWHAAVGARQAGAQMWGWDFLWCLFWRHTTRVVVFRELNQTHAVKTIKFNYLGKSLNFAADWQPTTKKSFRFWHLALPLLPKYISNWIKWRDPAKGELSSVDL